MFAPPVEAKALVPDLQDNVPVGKSNNKALASVGGANTVTSTGNVGGSTANATLSVNQLASHNHQIYNTGGNPQSNVAIPGLQYNANPGSVLQPTNAGNDAGHSHNMSANFAGDATSVLQPYLTIIYIIKT